MNKYIAAVRMSGTYLKTGVYTDSAIHTRMLLQYQFGMNCIVYSPTQTNEATGGYKTIDKLLKKLRCEL